MDKICQYFLKHNLPFMKWYLLWISEISNSLSFFDMWKYLHLPVSIFYCSDYDSLNEADVVKNNQLAFDAAQQEFGINPVMTGEDMANCDKPDKLTIVSYLSQFYDLFKKQRPPSGKFFIHIYVLNFLYFEDIHIHTNKYKKKFCLSLVEITLLKLFAKGTTRWHAITNWLMWHDSYFRQS